MGVAQTFAGLARVVAPLLATAIFQRSATAAPFYLAGACRGARGAAGVPDHRSIPSVSRRADGGRRPERLMSTDERLDRLEQRMAVLETLVRQLAAGRARSAPPAGAIGHGGLAGPAPAATRRRRSTGAASALRRRARVVRRRHAAGSPSHSTEQWIGQRVFLGVGVVALLMAAGYLLKLSFERGWISPIMRCIGGALLAWDRRRASGGGCTSAVPHLRRRAGRLRRRHHLPERLGGLPAVRGAFRPPPASSAWRWSRSRWP